jgi:hypothetical protein
MLEAKPVLLIVVLDRFFFTTAAIAFCTLHMPAGEISQQKPARATALALSLSISDRGHPRPVERAEYLQTRVKRTGKRPFLTAFCDRAEWRRNHLNTSKYVYRIPAANQRCRMGIHREYDHSWQFLVLIRLKRSLKVLNGPLLPPRRGTRVRQSQDDTRSTNELRFFVVPPPSAPFLRLLPSGSTFGVGPDLMGSPVAC